MSMRFTVGLKHKGKVNHVVVDAEDALIAALKAKTEHPEALIVYVRPLPSSYARQCHALMREDWWRSC